MPTASSPGSKLAYTAGHFELSIDDHKSTAYVKSIDGGFVKSSVIDEGIGPTNMRVKHTSTVEIDPFSIEFGLSGAGEVLKWIQQSWKMEPSRRNGQITHADFNLKSTYEHQFFHALIAETTFPTLDGSSREAAYMKIKVQPERIFTRKEAGRGADIGGGPTTKQKAWLPSAFRLTIDGLKGLEYTNKIDSFTIKQGIKKFYYGQERFPEIEPTKIEFPNLSCTIALEHADQLLRWGRESLIQGRPDPRVQRTGAIEFLSPDRKRTLFRVNLDQVGLHNLQIVQSTANSEQIKRVKFDLFVGAMELDTMAGFE